MTDQFDGKIGEGWAGEVPNGSHINVVVARRGSPTAAAITTALASPRPGHLPFLACLEPGVVVRPTTVVVNKSTLEGETLPRLTWGAAQLGIAQGVLDSVADGVIESGIVGELLLLVAVWVDPEGHDETAIRLANRDATGIALASAIQPTTDVELEALIARRDDARNAYYTGD